MTDKNIVQETFPVLGMSCASCAARIEKTLNRQSGVKRAAVNYASATATVEYDPKNCSSETLQQAVQAAGYDLLINRDGNTLEEAEEAHNKKFTTLKFRTVWAVILSLPVVIIGMFFMDMPYANPIMWTLSTPVVFWLGRGFFTSAWKQLQTWQRQYGHTGSHQYGDRLSVQPVQHAISGLLAIQRHPSACIF